MTFRLSALLLFTLLLAKPLVAGPPSTESAGNTTWAGGGAYDWEINNANGTAGVNWDFLDITGTLNITATEGSPFRINLISLTESNEAGNMANFDPTADYSYIIATASEGITGFDPTAIHLITNDFTNPATGSISLSKNGNNIALNYTGAAVPEPAAFGGILGLAVLGFVWIRRQRP